MRTISHQTVKQTEAALTIENFIELSWWGMDDKVGCYAYLHTKNVGYRLKDVQKPRHH